MSSEPPSIVATSSSEMSRVTEHPAGVGTESMACSLISASRLYKSRTESGGSVFYGLARWICAWTSAKTGARRMW